MSEPTRELYLSVGKEIARQNEVVRVMVSNLLPGIPYVIYVNDSVWISENASSNIVYNDFLCAEIGFYKFQAWMVYPFPPGYIWSNEDFLTVLSKIPDEDKRPNVLPVVIICLAIPAALILMGLGKKK